MIKLEKIDDMQKYSEEKFKEMIIDYHKQKLEIERLEKELEKYENPEDMTLMYMWCDEKAKDEIKRLHSIIKEVREYIEETPTDDDTSIYGIKDIRKRELLEILDKVDKEK